MGLCACANSSTSELCHVRNYNRASCGAWERTNVRNCYSYVKGFSTLSIRMPSFSIGLDIQVYSFTYQAYFKKVHS